MLEHRTFGQWSCSTCLGRLHRSIGVQRRHVDDVEDLGTKVIFQGGKQHGKFLPLERHYDTDCGTNNG